MQARICIGGILDVIQNEVFNEISVHAHSFSQILLAVQQCYLPELQQKEREVLRCGWIKMVTEFLEYTVAMLRFGCLSHA